MRKQHRVLITGSRNWVKAPMGNKEGAEKHWRRYTLIRKMLEELVPDKDEKTDLIVIHGGCVGVDMLADAICKEIGISRIIYPANWVKHGKAAGPIRNKEMFDDSKPDLVLAFHENLEKSSGTKHMVDYATKQEVTVLSFDESDPPKEGELDI